MNRSLYLACLAALVALAVLFQAQPASTADAEARGPALKLYESLSEEQKKAVVLPIDSKDRYAEIFPVAKRPGLSISQLTAEQKGLVEQMIRSMTSDYGATRCLEVAKQTGEAGRYLTFYGTPSKDGAFAWRVASHHLTLIYAEFGTDPVGEFGPILLGGNPVKTLWDDEDKVLVELFASLSPQDAKAIQGKGKAGSGAPMDPAAMKISSLGEKSRGLARQLLQQRLAVFAPERRKVIDKLIERDGGVDNLQITIWGDPKTGRAAGNNYSWRIGNATVVCDWQGVGKEHLHMTVRARKNS